MSRKLQGGKQLPQQEKTQQLIHHSTIDAIIPSLPQRQSLRGGAAAQYQSQSHVVKPQMTKTLQEVLNRIRQNRQAISRRWMTQEGSIVHSLHRAITRDNQLLVLRLARRLGPEFLNLQSLDDGGTAVHLAAQQGHNLTLAILLRYGADVNARDFFGRTPLMVAVASGRNDIVKILLDHNADIKKTDVFDYSAADYIPDDKVPVSSVFPKEYHHDANSIRKDSGRGSNIANLLQQISENPIMRFTQQQTAAQQQRDLDHILQQVVSEMTPMTPQETKMLKDLRNKIYGKK